MRGRVGRPFGRLRGLCLVAGVVAAGMVYPVALAVGLMLNEAAVAEDAW